MQTYIQSLQARIARATILPVRINTLPVHIVRKDTERNPRSIQSIIEENGELDCHEFDSHDNIPFILE